MAVAGQHRFGVCDAVYDAATSCFGGSREIVTVDRCHSCTMASRNAPSGRARDFCRR